MYYLICYPNSMYQVYCTNLQRSTGTYSVKQVTERFTQLLSIKYYHNHIHCIAYVCRLNRYDKDDVTFVTAENLSDFKNLYPEYFI